MTDYDREDYDRSEEKLRAENERLRAQVAELEREKNAACELLGVRNEQDWLDGIRDAITERDNAELDASEASARADRAEALVREESERRVRQSEGRLDEMRRADRIQGEVERLRTALSGALAFACSVRDAGGDFCGSARLVVSKYGALLNPTDPDDPDTAKDRAIQRFIREKLPEIREAARSVGYAIAVHGSLKRDIDLVAVPWTEAAVSAQEFVKAVTATFGEEGTDWGFGYKLNNPDPCDIRPHGRMTWAITPLNLGAYIDLSVMPIKQASVEDGTDPCDEA